MKPLSRVAIVVAATLLTSSALAATKVPPPPKTPTDNVVYTMHGVQISDPYRWLEDWSDPKVQAWSNAQNARTRDYLDHLPTRDAVKSALTRFVKATSPAYSQLEARGDVVFALYSDPAKQQPVLVTLNADADPASRHVVLDPNQLDPTGHTAMDWFTPSADGSKVAVSLSKDGSEAGTLHVFDVATGRDIGEAIPNVQFPTAGGSVAWAKGGAGFWYTRYPGDDAPAAERRFNMQVYFHKLGTDWHADPLVLGKKDGLERISEVFLDNRYDHDKVMAMVQRGDGNHWAFFVLSADEQPVQIGTYTDDIVYATFGPDDAVYAISRKDASNGMILKLTPPFASMGLDHASVLVPQGKVAIVSGGAEEHGDDLSFSRDHLFVRDITGGPNDVRVFTLDGKPDGMLPLPAIASNDEIVPLTDGDVLYNVSTYLRPPYYADWNPKTGETHETALKVTSPISYADAEVVREFATSKDGTKIPVNIIMKKGVQRNGQNPVLLYGYGGFGISMTPSFLGPAQRLWLDAGGIYAVANIRGGSEYGERWHQDGMLTKKQNDFDDFAASAQYLIDQGYTSHDKLALMGGSNGGLLMGAVVTQHPRLARAVVSAVGIYDMIRNEGKPNGAFNTTEYGSIADPAQFKALLAYSPYQHVTKGADYPAMLLLTGATDGRVDPMNSRKMVAAMQAATASDHPILLRTSMNSGHGIGSSLEERIDEQTDELTFLFDQIGMAYPK